MEKVKITNINSAYIDSDYEIMINGLFNAYIESVSVELANLLMDLKSTIETLKDNTDKVKSINKHIETIRTANLALSEDNEKSEQEKLGLYLNIDTDRTRLVKNYRERESKKKIINERIKHSSEVMKIIDDEIIKLKEQIKKINHESREQGILFSNHIRNIIALLMKINVEGLDVGLEELNIENIKYINSSHLSDLEKTKINSYIHINFYLRKHSFKLIQELANKIFECYRKKNYLEIEKILNSNKCQLALDILINNDLTRYKTFKEVKSSDRFELEYELNREILNYLEGYIYDDDYLERLTPYLRENKDKDIYNRVSLFIKSIDDDRKETLRHDPTSKR